MEWRILFIITICLILFSLEKHVDSLMCYHCEEEFDHVWDPYTNCQINPNLTVSKQCVSEEQYCMVKRVSFKGMTIQIQRKCTDSCWYGCRVKDFGITKLTCISCCQENHCNIGGSGTNISANTIMLLMVTCMNWILMR